MLKRLLKHEFRATKRIMLPVLGVLIILTLLFNLSVRGIETTDSNLLTVLFGLIIAAFVIGMIAAEVIVLVLMISRFRQNLLGREGYLMHTLPVNVHGLVWSKMIVSFIWFLVTNLLIVLLLFGTMVFLSESNIFEIFREFPSWNEIREALAQAGVNPGSLAALGLEWLLLIICCGLVTCLHFYAALSLGHSIANHKMLYSLLFFIGISFFFSFLSSSMAINSTDMLERVFNTDSAIEAIRNMQALLGVATLWTLFQAALLYVATVLGLKRWLNLG